MPSSSNCQFLVISGLSEANQLSWLLGSYSDFGKWGDTFNPVKLNFKHHSIFGFAPEAGPCLRGNHVFSQAKKIPPRAVGVQFVVYKPFLYIMGLKQPVWGIFTKVAFGPAPYVGG